VTEGLDNRTLLLVAGGLYVLLPLSVWVVLRMPRQPAPVLWCSGGVLGGVGLMLMGLRGAVPDTLSYLVGQPLIALGAMLLAQSLRLDLGRAWASQRVALVAAVYTGILWALLDSEQVLAVDGIIRSVNLLAVLLLARAAWQVGRAEGSRNAMLIAAGFCVQAAGILANLVNSLQGSVDLHTLSGSRVAVAVSLVTLLVSLVSAMGYLGLALERMARRQLASARELSRATQRHERREALVRLERERLLSILADSLAHQIMQPLTAALLRVRTGQRQLALGALDSERQTRWVEHAVEDIRRAGATVERVRGLIRPVSPRQEPVDMRAVLRDVQQLLRQEAIIRQVGVRFSLPAQRAHVMGDALELCQAVLQVARNAMAALAGQPRRELSVVLDAMGDQVRVLIADTGPGFPGTSLRPASGQGLPRLRSLQGIGLFVVQSIVERHQGEVLLSPSQSGGAVVTMSFPRAEEAGSAPGAPPREPDEA